MIDKIYVTGGSQCIAAGFIWEEVKKIYPENIYKVFECKVGSKVNCGKYNNKDLVLAAKNVPSMFLINDSNGAVSIFCLFISYTKYSFVSVSVNVRALSFLTILIFSKKFS